MCEQLDDDARSEERGHPADGEIAMVEVANDRRRHEPPAPPRNHYKERAEKAGVARRTCWATSGRFCSSQAIAAAPSMRQVKVGQDGSSLDSFSSRSRA